MARIPDTEIERIKREPLPVLLAHLVAHSRKLGSPLSEIIQRRDVGSDLLMAAILPLKRSRGGHRKEKAAMTRISETEVKQIRKHADSVEPEARSTSIFESLVTRTE